MINIKTAEQIADLKEGGKISAKILDYALSLCKPGITTLKIDSAVVEKMKQMAVSPWFSEVGDYPLATCISVNEIWLHGIPGNRKLKENDIVSIDIGVKYKGLYLDNCWTVVVGRDVAKNVRNAFDHPDPEISCFLKTGALALEKAISSAKPGNRVGDISSAMQETVESAGYSVIREFSGHGVGLKAHEEPGIACYGTKGAGPKLEAGMVLAVEIMYAKGNNAIKMLDDGWTIVTRDGSMSAMFEHTVVIEADGPEVLTVL